MDMNACIGTVRWQIRLNEVSIGRIAGANRLRCPVRQMSEVYRTGCSPMKKIDLLLQYVGVRTANIEDRDVLV